MRIRITITSAIVCACALSAQANLETYFGETVSIWPIGGLNQVPRPTNIVACLQAAAQFYSRLPGVVTEGFEGYPDRSSPTNLFFGTNVATLSGTCIVVTYPDPMGTIDGGFPISGTNAPNLDGGSGQFFSITFSAPQAAFGFFVTDVERNQLVLTLVDGLGGRRNIQVPVTRPQGSGGCFFFGIIDKALPFVTIEFHNVGTQGDGFALDDMTIAVPEQVLPAPAELDAHMYAGLTIAGTVTAQYTIEYAPSPESTNWTTLTNITLPSSPYLWFDTTSTSTQARYYRAVGVP
jgi:hypothetical protein